MVTHRNRKPACLTICEVCRLNKKKALNEMLKTKTVQKKIVGKFRNTDQIQNVNWK
jgi:hypothetical protein